MKIEIANSESEETKNDEYFKKTQKDEISYGKVILSRIKDEIRNRNEDFVDSEDEVKELKHSIKRYIKEVKDELNLINKSIDSTNKRIDKVKKKLPIIIPKEKLEKTSDIIDNIKFENKLTRSYVEKILLEEFGFKK